MAIETKIRIVRLGHMVYAHKNVDAIKTFLIDFGFEVESETGDEIFFRGYGEQPYLYVVKKTDGEPEFLGGCWVVESRADLERAAKLPGATPITPVKAPGGGEEVVVRDPDNFPFRLIFGQQMRTAEPHPVPQVTNYADQKKRAGEFIRFNGPKPAKVHKLGHYGCITSDYQATLNWMTSNFNFYPTDVMTLDDGRHVGAFLRLQRGAEYVDHHCYFFSQGPTPHVHHCSFEIHDVDMQQLSHKYLSEKGYELAWGVGRHLLGSQIFDYWYDPSARFMVEHYCDGDILNESTPTTFCPAKDETLAIWGPDVPATFLD